tara:strand:- start:33 stop:224 length:192 start_codon:yes stop_codon:yes gene_type:complete
MSGMKKTIENDEIIYSRKKVIDQLNYLVGFTDRMGGLRISSRKSHALLTYLKKYSYELDNYRK